MISVHDLAHSKGVVETPAMYALLEMQSEIVALETEIEQLRSDYNKASIDGAADERAKIVAWLRLETWGIAAGCIAAGEHLK
jgi:hypothetical protein